MSTCPSGGCANCGGCATTLTLTDGEIRILQSLGQIPFQPVARKAQDMIPVYLEDPALSQVEAALILQVMEKKGLISLDYDKPIAGMDMTAYGSYPVQGSMALTAMGQTVLEMLDLNGIEEA